MRAFFVAGLGYGDEGKGTMVDSLCRYHGANWVVRYNGGPQAGHNVVLPDGRHHTFSQFGSGSFSGGCQTYLSEHMLIEPYAMLNEAQVAHEHEIYNILKRTWINPKCVIITPWHWWTNRIKELSRGSRRHGSCGMGVGEAREGQINGTSFRVGDLFTGYASYKLQEIKYKQLGEAKKYVKSPETEELYTKMTGLDCPSLLSFYKDIWFPQINVQNWSYVTNVFNPQNVVFEGAQGVLLDETHGFGNHVTWTDCTFNNAFEILNHYGVKEKNREIIRIGVIRSFLTRHGPGPFVTEVEGGLVPGMKLHKDKYNVDNPWQGNLRVGYFDALALRYALRAIGDVDYLAMTHMDSVAKDYWPYCDAYFYRDDLITDIIQDEMKHPEIFKCFFKHATNPDEGLQNIASVPIGYKSFGPTHEDKTVSEEIGRREKHYHDRTLVN